MPLDSDSSVVQASPTVLSSDLFSPGVATRVTFPGVRVFRRPNNVREWGTESTEYGGVGKLPVLAPGTINDIVTSRSHRHYSSGIKNCNAYSRPYAVTSLMLSECRINDELLPAPFNAKFQQLEEPWPGHAFTSHTCRFDVFPRFDPQRTEFDVSYRRKPKQKLKAATEEALEQLSNSIYRTSVYQDTMKDPKHSRVQVGEGSGDRAARFRGEDKSQPNGLETWQVSDQADIENDELSEDDDETEENKLKNEELPNDSKHSAVWPIWPVGLNNMHKAPLHYPKIPLPQYTPLDFSRTNRLQKNNINIKSKPAVREEQTMQFNASAKRSHKKHARITSKYIPALTAYASSTLGLGESKHLKFTHPETKNLNEMRRLRVDLVPVKDLAAVDHLRLPLIEREKTNMQSQDQPSDRKHCATGRLGVRFKTDAHKRYHQMYSDIIHDLRDSTITGRQHFFGGVHACVLR